MLAGILSACGSRGGPVSTALPAATVTPRATLLPPVPTQVPYGSNARPYQVVLVPPADSAETGTALASFLKDRTGLTFKVNVVTANADVLSALCGSVPTIAWVDGWTMLAASSMGCANAVLRVKRDGATGIRSDIIISPAAQIDTIAALGSRSRNRDFCRLSSQDTVTWVLPVILMRTASGFDPLTEFKTIRDYTDMDSILADVSDNKCVSAIASDTLSNYKLPNISDITRTIKVLATTPELPYGGLMVSGSIPPEVTKQLSTTFTGHVDALKGLVTADDVAPISVGDLSTLLGGFKSAGIDFNSLAH